MVRCFIDGHWLIVAFQKECLVPFEDQSSNDHWIISSSSSPLLVCAVLLVNKVTFHKPCHRVRRPQRFHCFNRCLLELLSISCWSLLHHATMYIGWVHKPLWEKPWIYSLRSTNGIKVCLRADAGRRPGLVYPQLGGSTTTNWFIFIDYGLWWFITFNYFWSWFHHHEAL